MSENVKKTSDYRLIDAAIEQWERYGYEGVSTRQLSAIASVPSSSIYHHFGSLEQLLGLAQVYVQGLAQQWCDDRIAQLAGMPRDPRAFPAFFAACVDDWVRNERRLAFAWREGQLLRANSQSGSALQQQWQRLWIDFWQEATARFGLERGAGVVYRLFENESSLHMIDWRRSVDRAGLDEFARGVGAWLMGDPVPPAPWRDFARAAALEALPAEPHHDSIMAQIVEAAAALVEEVGPGGLTHRAVAASSGLTLGTVSHKVRTKAELVQVGYGGLYIKAVSRLRAQTSVLPSGRDTVGSIAHFLAENSGSRGIDALHLAVARDPALRQFGLQLRYLRGSTSRSLLQMLLPDRLTPGHLEPALLSSFLSSLSRHYGDWTADEARAPIRAELEDLVALL
ncbi:MAG: TetR/AcrR family transcriptional regulator [Sphingobium sp.]|uniref:TetR/AcrR family transcriptional regulator n=1 Tax=Sphingobium sp. TaxID=1912891 RepID=UPI001A21B327|nr:TetR/AcrR family transcriptional regulator [Sphingobium sp.]MBJ7442741.1 TetR/AcrR family transcriptional regulator [Sphingobium sp.]